MPGLFPDGFSLRTICQRGRVELRTQFMGKPARAAWLVFFKGDQPVQRDTCEEAFNWLARQGCTIRTMDSSAPVPANSRARIVLMDDNP